MNPFPDISAKQLIGANWLLQKNIGAATIRANDVLSHGKMIRAKLQEGNINSSLDSTSEGAVNVARNISSRFSLDEVEPEDEHSHNAFFGQNLRRTINALKVLGRR